MPAVVRTSSSVATSSRMSTALSLVPLVRREKVSDLCLAPQALCCVRQSFISTDMKLSLKFSSLFLNSGSLRAVWRSWDLCQRKESDRAHRPQIRSVRNLLLCLPHFHRSCCYPALCCALFMHTFTLLGSDFFICLQEIASSWARAMCSGSTTLSRLGLRGSGPPVLKHRLSPWTGPLPRGSCWINRALTWNRKWNRGTLWNRTTV